MTCPACGGSAAGCGECDAGRIEITQCPLECIDEDVWKIIMLAELFEKGLPPVAGGTLDQAKVFVEAAYFIFREQNYWKRKLKIFD